MNRLKHILKYVEHIIKETMFLAPIAMLVISFISAFINYGVYGYVLLGNTSGYGLIADVPLLGIFTFNKKYCVLTRISPIGLVIINIIDLVGYYFDPKFYDFWYVVITGSFVFGLGIIFTIRKYIRV